MSARGWAWMHKRRPCTEDPLCLYIIDPVLYVLYMSVQLTLIATPSYPILKKIQLGPEGPSNLPKDTQCIERQKPGFKCRPVDSQLFVSPGLLLWQAPSRPRPCGHFCVSNYRLQYSSDAGQRKARLAFTTESGREP